MKSIKILATLTLTASMSACITLPKQPVPDQPALHPANLLVRCDSLPTIGTKANLGDVVKYTTDLMKRYNECAIRHDGLIDSVTPKKKD